MHKNWVRFSLIGASCIMLAGCSDGTGSDDKTDGNAVCEENETQCHGDVVQTCKDGEWTDTKNCKNGCKKGKCQNSDTSADPQTECENGEKQCRGDVAQSCKDGEWTDTETCKNGCNKGQCQKTDESGDSQSGCNKGETQCYGNVLQTCKDGVWANGNICDYGCAQGRCNEKIDDRYSCDGIQCDSGEACFNGTCLETAKEGDSCSVSMFTERCLNNGKVQYCDHGFVLDFACKATESCIVSPDINGAGHPRADCLDTSFKCKMGDADKLTCQKATNNKYYLYTEKCSVTTADDYYYQTIGSVECPSGCNGTSACAETQSCSANSFSMSCTGNTLKYCTSESVVGLMDCSYASASATCQLFKDGKAPGVDYASCYTQNSACTKEGETRTKCSEATAGKAIVTTHKCLKSTAGKLYWVQQNKKTCESNQTCNDTMTDCVAAQSCTVASFNETCTGQIASYCSAGKVSRFNCDDYTTAYGKKHTCQTFKNNGHTYAQCVSDDDICTNTGTKTTTCKDSSQGAYLYTTQCVKAESGTKSYQIDPDDPTSCGQNKTCNATFTACEDAKACSSSTQTSCSGKAYTYCDSKTNKLVNRNCQDLGADYECVSSGNAAGCYSKCSTVNTMRKTCVDVYGMGTFATVSYQCTNMGSGTYWKGTDDAPVLCTNGCNADNTDCL